MSSSSSVANYGSNNSVSFDSYESVVGFQASDADVHTHQEVVKSTKRSSTWLAGVAMLAMTVAVGLMVSFDRGSMASLQTYMAETSAIVSNTLAGTRAAKVVGTSRPAHSLFTELPDVEDADAIHSWIKANYLVYSSWIIAAGAKTAPVPMDLPEREPESNLGNRERNYAPIKESGFIIFASFMDPDCKSYYGFMSMQLNKCVPSWLGSTAEEGPKLYYTIQATVSESMVTTTTHTYTDSLCTVELTNTVNMTNNMACNAWGSHDNVFTKFAFAKVLPDLGSGAQFTGYGDSGCAGDVQEALYIDQADGEFCSGGVKAVCDTATKKATLTHYIDVDYECNSHAIAEGYPMITSTACAWDNSFGLSAYGKASCGAPTEGYMAVPGVAPQLGGAYVIPDLEVWKPESPEVQDSSATGPAGPEEPEKEAEKEQKKEDAAPAPAEEEKTEKMTFGGPAAQKNGPPPGSVKSRKA